jgi:O-antigen/teichoic acid export membrane protein
MKLRNTFAQILRTDTFSQSLLTISATVFSGLLGLLFYMAVGRNLGPAAFGIFTVVTTTLALIADTGDLGTNTGLIRFIGKYIDDRSVALKFLKLGLEIKIIVWILVLVLGWFLSPTISQQIFQKSELTDPLRLGFLGVGGALFLSFSAHALQAYQKYKIWSLILVGSNLFRLLVVLLIIFTLTFNTTSALAVYITVPFIFSVFALIYLPKFLSVKEEFTVAKEFFRFNMWIFLITIIAALSSRLDVFLLTRMLTIEQVGIYSVAVQLTSFVPQLFFAVATVSAPKFASFHSNNLAVNYLKKLQLFITGIATIGLIGIPVAYFIIVNLFGLAYSASFTPFIVLYIAQLIFLLALPTHQTIFYYFGKPQILVPVALLQLFVIFFSGVALINLYGVLGAAVSVLIGNLFLLFIPAFWVIYKLRK